MLRGVDISLRACAATAFAVAVSCPLNAAPVTADSFVDRHVVDFSQATVSIGSGGAAKVDVGTAIGEEVLISSTANGAYTNYKDSVILGANGLWSGLPSAQNGIAFQGAFGTRPGEFATMLFEFDSPVSGVGAFMNYYRPYSGSPYPVVLSALADDGSVLESFDVEVLAPISTGGWAYRGGFRGFSRPQADIYAFSLTGAVVLDDLVLSRDAAPAVVSEPGTLLIAGAALASLFAVRRRWYARALAEDGAEQRIS